MENCHKMLYYHMCMLWYPICRNPWGTRYPFCQNPNANTEIVLHYDEQEDRVPSTWDLCIIF